MFSLIFNFCSFDHLFSTSKDPIGLASLLTSNTTNLLLSPLIIDGSTHSPSSIIILQSSSLHNCESTSILAPCLLFWWTTGQHERIFNQKI